MGDINIVYIIDTGDDKLGVDQVRVYNSNDTTSSSDVTTWEYVSALYMCYLVYFG